MYIVLIILSVLLWVASGWMLFRKELLAPALSYVALLVLSFASKEGYPLLPVNNVILVSWLCITLVVMVTTILQPQSVRESHRGMGYISVGALAGMAIGLLGFSFTESVTMCYSIMVVATLAGTFFGYLLYGNTPSGRADRGAIDGSRLQYLLAKGFPACVAVMQLGIALVLAIAIYDNTAM